MIHDKKTLEELKILNDKRLLNYYRAMRGRTRAFVNSFNYYHEEDEEQIKSVIKTVESYLTIIKTELESRGNID